MSLISALLSLIGIMQLLYEYKDSEAEVDYLSRSAFENPVPGTYFNREDLKPQLYEETRQYKWDKEIRGRNRTGIAFDVTRSPLVPTSPSAITNGKGGTQSTRNMLLSETDVSSLGMILNDHDEKEFLQNKKHAFNAFLSSRLPLNRDVPDFRYVFVVPPVTLSVFLLRDLHRVVLIHRNPKCMLQSFHLPPITASIVICFHEEAKSALLRTVSSVVSRTADILLKEIILIDDASISDELQKSLQSELLHLSSKINFIQLPTREGLIRARMSGARQATGDVLVFLDSHTEVGNYWLEPLLSEIHCNRTTVVCPVIDLIQAHSLKIEASPAVSGGMHYYIIQTILLHQINTGLVANLFMLGFNWGLHFRWDVIDRSKMESTEAFDSPAMSGGIFAMDRSYFNELGN